MGSITQPDVRPVSVDRYMLHADYCVHGLATPDMGWWIRAGFVFDGASVPRWLWSLSGFTPDGLHRAAVLIHDYLYARCGQTDDPYVRPYSRRGADRLMRKIMIASGVPRRRAYLAYIAARLFGGAAWRR